jgi:glycerol-3-phosphate acyltransferase PlsY
MLIALVVPYLLGSLNTAVVVSRLLYGEDVRTKGSGNAGLTNMLRVYGKKAALWVLLGNVLKMVLSLLFTGLFLGFQYGPYAFSLNPFMYVAGTACIIGHIFPVYFRFKGGKGVLCTAAMVLVLSPIVFAVEIAIFILLLVVTHYVSLSSIVVGLGYPLILNRMMAFFGYPVTDGMILLLSVLVGLLILYCHRSNIVRLKEHRENRFYFSSAKREADRERRAKEEAELKKAGKRK